MSAGKRLSALGRLVTEATYVVLAALSYLLAVAAALAAILVAFFFVSPDPCLPMCVAAETTGGRGESIGSGLVLAAAGVAGLGVLYLMARRWGTGRALLVPWLALLVVVPLAVGGLVGVDLLTADAEVLSCSC